MSANALSEIQAQIAALEAQAQELRAAAAAQRQDEVAAVVQEIQAKIAEYGLSAKDLGLSTVVKSRRAPTTKPAKASAPASGPVYKGPNGETWTGGSRGRKPQWLTQALAEGKQLSDLIAA